MKKKVIVIIAALMLAGVFFVLYHLREKDDGAIRTSGIVDGIEVNLASKISGRISEICCNEGESIQEGQVAVRLESSDLKASVEQAAAGVERARADVSAAEAGIENAKANVLNTDAEMKSAEADLEKARVQRDEAKRDMQRADDLYKKDFIAKASFDQAVALYDTTVAAEKAAAAKLKAALARKNAVAAQLDASASQLKASHARLKESEAALAYSRSKLEDATIQSPVSGAVIFKALEKGENVSPGSVILTIVELAGLYVRADIEETMVGPVTLGSEASVTIESLPGKVFKGKVSEIGRYAEFATQRDVTRGRQDIKTFRVKIKVGDTGGILKPGMTVNVQIAKKTL
jgi:HlyD family secretion protein